jgi:methylated-DNA-[protein]-cysteine S-methyltransferase
MTIDMVKVDTPIGLCFAEVDGGAVRRAGFDEWGSAVRGDRRVHDALVAYFAGDVGALDGVPVQVAGTAFQTRVWAALREIPPGETRSYGELAAAVGVPGGARAVGMANASNPVPLFVPCHRVVRAGGALGGYGLGVDRKRWLLDHESRSNARAVATP